MADPDRPAPDDALVLAPDCRRCPALVESRDRIAWGNGPTDAAVVVVGEAPAAGDPDAPEWPGGNRSGLAYTSRHSGRRIRSLLADLGIDDAFYTNAVKCFPADGDGSNREPTAAERANCRSHLRTEVETVDPAVVLPTGRHATASLLAVEGRELDGFVDRVLDPVDCPTLDTTAVPLLHPSYADVWRSRLGYDREGYRTALARTLRACGVDADG
ncbi:uracil-DNA glycosylase [Haloplanus halophilus]|uniref:uracil-DNA glycosylase n=1 Tax=Haloplanus halophilus TaxID=2949993 RepID=UPI00203AD7F8|nr:uracil-DNA glycosylase family protein [Haloplanus sp. GDY1]